MATWRELQEDTARHLGAHGISSAGAEARWMIEDFAGCNAAQMALHLDEPAEGDDLKMLDTWLERRERGEPLQYILGHWSFRGLAVLVDERVLIPRPETEVVVQTAVDILKIVPGSEELIVADLGTGSGVIAISVATEIPHAEVWATDMSESALQVARINATIAGLIGDRVQFRQGDWFDALPQELHGELNLIVSNPPYIAESEMSELPDEVRMFEPHEALVSGTDGLDATRIVLSEARNWLAPNGHVVLEIAEQRAQETMELAQKYGFTNTHLENDLAGKPRCLVTKR